MSGSLKLRDVLSFVESLKGELRTAHKDTEAQKSIVRGQAAQIQSLTEEMGRKNVWAAEQGKAIENLKAQAVKLREAVLYVHPMPPNHPPRTIIPCLACQVLEGV